MANKAIMPFEDYQAACDAIREKTGGTALIKSGEMAGLIEGIVGGGSTENLDAEVAAQVTLLNTQEEKIAELAEILAGKAAGEGGGEPNLQDKIVTPTESKQTITADNNYDGLDTVTVNAIPSEYIVRNEISEQDMLISNIINALDGKAAGGSAEPNLQDKTVTPTTSTQTVTADNGYDGLDTVTIQGDANLVAGNIKSGTSIFGVSGTYVGAGGGSSNLFPYKITLTSTGLSLSNPTICYGDNNDIVYIVTRANLGGAYKCSWTFSNCSLFYQGMQLDGNGLGDYAVFGDFTGNATINVHWAFNSGDY